MSDEIPEGWRFTREWDHRTKGMKEQGPVYRRLTAACESKKVRAYKQGKLWVVNVADAEAFLSPPVEAKQRPKPVAADLDELTKAGIAELVVATQQIRSSVETWGMGIAEQIEELVKALNCTTEAIQRLPESLRKQGLAVSRHLRDGEFVVGNGEGDPELISVR